MKKSEYINLKINGRMFPTWVMANFKDYKLPEIIQGTDPCNETYKDELRKYQTFIGKYLDNASPYKDILLYHGLGAGKTATIINLYNVLYNASTKWNFFLLIRASLHNEPWLAELKKWLDGNEAEKMKNIYWVHYDSPYADRDFLEAIKKSDSTKQNVFVIEEAHNFIKNVYSNISSQDGKKAQLIYTHLEKEKIENPTTRIIAISATPAINSPYELALLFNLLRPGTFPKSEAQFNSVFVKTGQFPTISETTKNTFQRRIMGLVSFYIGATPEYFATQMRHNIDVEMSNYQEKIYEYYEEIEAKQMRRNVGRSESYRTYTRQACNFVFPHIDQNVNGEARPRPGKFRITEREAAQLEQGEIALDKKSQLAKYYETMEMYISSLKSHFNALDSNDKKNGYTIFDDVKTYVTQYNGNYEEFIKHDKHSKLLLKMRELSHKMVRIILNISLSKGPVLVYSNYVLMEGLQIFKIYLNYFGYRHISEETKPGFNFAEFHGGIDQKERTKTVQIFKDPKNIHGDFAKIILISPAGSEGISLFNMRQVHIMEPYWHETRIVQMIGRAVRFCSHKTLPKEERHVDVFRYKSIRHNGKQTTDQYIEDLARSKDNLIQSFLEPIKEVAVDCALFRNHNKLLGNYKCFQFNENSLFDNNVGPAYKQDLKDDLRLENGLNSVNSKIIKLRVSKIKAVKLINSDLTNPKYSKVDNYWYSSDTKVVYDYDLHFPVGKVATEDDLPIKTDTDVYIIDKIVAIPIISN